MTELSLSLSTDARFSVQIIRTYGEQKGRDMILYLVFTAKIGLVFWSSCWFRAIIAIYAFSIRDEGIFRVPIPSFSVWTLFSIESSLIRNSTLITITRYHFSVPYETLPQTHLLKLLLNVFWNYFYVQFVKLSLFRFFGNIIIHRAWREKRNTFLYYINNSVSAPRIN